MLSVQAMETLSQFRDSYEQEIVDVMTAPAKKLASMRYENNRFYLETVLQELSPEEIKQTHVSDIIAHLLRKKLITHDEIEIGRATDAIKILQHYLLTRPDV